MSGGGVDVYPATAGEEFKKAVKKKDITLYRNAVGKTFLSMVVTVNSYIYRKLNVTPKPHYERSHMIRKMEVGRLKDSLQRRDEAYYEGIYNSEEAEYAIKQVKKMFEELEKGRDFRIKNSTKGFLE